jgi:hypothetical protein
LIIVKIIIFITQIILFLIPRIFRTQIIIFFYMKTLNYYKNNNIITKIIISLRWILGILRKIIILTKKIIIFFILILRIVEYF